MGKRIVDLCEMYETPPIRRTIRKRKVSSAATRPAKVIKTNSDADDDEDSSNDAQLHNFSSKQANNSSILLNSSIKIEQCSPATNESPRPVYTLRPSVVNGTILYDIMQKPWRLGNPIGKGNFGEIFLASDNITVPVTNDNAKYVVKIEPHSNGPLFVEIHCLMNTAKHWENTTTNESKLKNKINSELLQSAPSGIPDYIASGSHYFGDARYRFLVLSRFDQDLHSLIKNSCVSQKSLLTLAIQILKVLENLHDKGYCHNDVKSQNLMISKCKYLQKNVNQIAPTKSTTKKLPSKYLDNYEEKQPTTDSGNSSEQEGNEYYEEREFVLKRKLFGDMEDDEDFDDGTATSNSNSNSNSTDIYKTPVMKRKNRARAGSRALVQYSGSNPVRSCRRQERRNSTYEEMVNSHYLRPSKRVSYAEFFTEDGSSIKGDQNDGDSSDTYLNFTDDESNSCTPHSIRRHINTYSTSSNKKTNNLRSKHTSKGTSPAKRLTRRQEKLLSQQQHHHQEQEHHKTSSVDSFDKESANMVVVEAEHIFLIDFGLASKYIDNGAHRPFVMDQRRAHDGTLEFTSRDAHMGAHSRRSDLECLGFNLLFWSQGFLPWKDAAAQQQQEKVHRAKEYLMTDVREMLKQIYGKDVPKYLGEFLHLVGKLAYHERPQYARYIRLFEIEYQNLGYSLDNMCLNSSEIAQSCVRIKKNHGDGKHDFFEQNKLSNNNILSIMKNCGTPFQERASLGDRVSPKNLRSKSDKKSTRKKKFCWAEILSQDPDQIARERAEKEFDRELNEEEEKPVRRYVGKPTYAIMELLKKNGVDYLNETIEVSDVEESGDDEDVGNTKNKEEEAKDSDIDETYEAEESEEEDEDSSGESENETDQCQSNDEDDDGRRKKKMIVDSEISESSSNFEQYTTRGRNKTRNVKEQKSNRRTSKRKSKPPAIDKKTLNSNSRNIKKLSSCKVNVKSLSMGAKKPKIPTQSRKNNTEKIKNETQPQHQLNKSQKNETKNRKTFRANAQGIGAAASAAGEVEQKTLTRFLYENRHGQQQQNLNGKISNGRNADRQERSEVTERKRRSLLKTESIGITHGRGGPIMNGRLLDTEDDSNSNSLLFNTWKKNNENIYERNVAAAATGGGMVTRHYRKY